MPRINKVAIFGGTHGNETNGVYVVDALIKDLSPVQRPTVTDVALVHTNPRAIDAVVRFVDEDLNRQFRYTNLADAQRTTCYEHVRAKEINARYGPKPAPETPPRDPNDQPVGAVDLCIDLHTTTSSMGCTFIVPCRDKVSLCIAAYAMRKMEGDERIKAGAHPCRILYNDQLREDAPYISTIGRHAVMIECGPTPWGVVRHDINMMMTTALGYIMDYVNDGVNQNKGPTDMVNGCVIGDKVAVMRGIIDPVTGLGVKIPAPCNEHGRPSAMFHPDMQDNDWKVLRKGDPIYVHMDGSVQCYDGKYGDAVQCHFVNEAAYYLKSSGLGFGVCEEVFLPTEP